MATSVSGLVIAEALQKSLVEKCHVPYLPNITSQFSTGLKKGDTAKVPLIKSGASTAWHDDNNNYAGTGSTGTVTSVDCLLNKHRLITLKLPPYINGRVQVQNAVDSAVRQLMHGIATDLFATVVAGTYTNTAVTIGASGDFSYADFIALKDEMIAKSMNPTMTTAALTSAYITALESDPAVYNDLAFRAAVAGNGQTSALISRVAGMNTLRTGLIATTDNVVGALFDDTAAVIAFGNNAPYSGDTNVGFYQEVADPDTGFNLAVSETYDQASRSMVLGIEAVYGIKEGDITKLSLLRSAAPQG